MRGGRVSMLILSCRSCAAPCYGLGRCTGRRWWSGWPGMIFARLSQWAERDSRAFAWVSVDDRDNDPKVLLTYVARALDQVEPVGGRVFEALASPTSSVPGAVVPRLAAAFTAMTSPVVLVVDDVHLLH